MRACAHTHTYTASAVHDYTQSILSLNSYLLRFLHKHVNEVIRLLILGSRAVTLIPTSVPTLLSKIMTHSYNLSEVSVSSYNKYR